MNKAQTLRERVDSIVRTAEVNKAYEEEQKRIKEAQAKHEWLENMFSTVEQAIESNAARGLYEVWTDDKLDKHWEDLAAMFEAEGFKCFVKHTTKRNYYEDEYGSTHSEEVPSIQYWFSWANDSNE